MLISWRIKGSERNVLTDTAVTARKMRPDKGSELSRMKMNGERAVDKAKDDSEKSLYR
jgi:hypothetical protein